MGTGSIATTMDHNLIAAMSLSELQNPNTESEQLIDQAQALTKMAVEKSGAVSGLEASCGQGFGLQTGSSKRRVIGPYLFQERLQVQRLGRIVHGWLLPQGYRRSHSKNKGEEPSQQDRQGSHLLLSLMV